MADKNDNDIDRGDSVRHASEEARAKAMEKMKQAQAKEAEKAEAEKSEGSSGASTMADFVGASTTTEEEGEYKQTIDEESGQPLLKSVKVYSPFKVYFENDAFSVSAVNGTGPFDILPGHKNFLSLLLPGDILIRARAGEEKIKIDRGVMHVHNDVIKVFLDV